MKTQFGSIWERLYQDPALGAGNFLFKAYEAYPVKDQEFLFVEQPFVAPGGITYRAFSLETLHAAVQDLAAWYTQCEVQTGSYVCLYLAEGVASFIHFLALNSLGCTPVLINGNLRGDIAAAYMAINRFNVFVYDAETEARWAISEKLAGRRGLKAAFTPSQTPTSATLPDSIWPVPRQDGDAIMICHSSGTTGIPKAVMFTHDQFFNGKRERLLGFIELENERLVTAIPATHAAGISYLMTATLLQVPTLALTTQTGTIAANLVATYEATLMTAFQQTYASFARLGLPDGYLKTLRRFYNTADSAHEAHIRELLRLAPEARFTDMFGASELGMSQFFKVSQAGAVASARTVGKPAGYADCAILSPSGELLGDGEPGYIGVRSPTITPGYYGQPHITELTRLNSYWLTGDVGLRKPNGEYVHLDRIVDVIDTCLGVKAYTLLLEEHLLKRADIFDVTVVGVKRGPTNEQAVVAFVQGKNGVRLDAADVLRGLLSAYPFQGRERSLPPYALSVGILADGYELPTGSTGKVLKRVIRDGYWEFQREYDEGRRDQLAELVWNHQLDLSDVPTAPPRKLIELVAAA